MSRKSQKSHFLRHSMKNDVLIRVAAFLCQGQEPKTQDTKTDLPSSTVLLPFLLPLFSLKTSQNNRKTWEQPLDSHGYAGLRQQESDQQIPSPLIPTTTKSPFMAQHGRQGCPSCPGFISLPQLQYSIFPHPRKTGKLSRPFPAGRHFLFTGTKCSIIKITRSVTNTRNMGTGCLEKVWTTEGGFR